MYNPALFSSNHLTISSRSRVNLAQIITFLFDGEAKNVASAAVIPLVAGADLGLLGLGGSEADRFQSSMGTEFLSQVGELVSAALAVHLEE